MEKTTDILERLIEEEQKLRQRAEELGIHLGPEPSEEVKAPFRARPGIPRTELTDRELSSLFQETRDILDIYTMDYMAEHIDEAQSLYESLRERPFSPDSLIGSRIVQNIQELKNRIDAVRERGSPERSLQEFLQDTKRLFDSLDQYDPEQRKRRYADLLRQEELLPKKVDQTLETEIEEYLTEIGKRIQRKEKKTSEEIAQELLENISTLMGAGKFDPEGYNKMAKEFQKLSEDLPDDLRLKVRDRIKECYSRMKEFEKKTKSEEREKEVRTKKFYWDSFASDVSQLKTDLEKARPGEFFRLYDMYNQILDTLEHADLAGVPPAQVERTKSMLDECYYLLEELRSGA